jgi:hypothetical protein
MDNSAAGDNLVDMIDDNTNRKATIPSVFLAWKDGHMIRNSLNRHGINGAIINIPLNITYKKNYDLKKAPWSFW